MSALQVKDDLIQCVHQSLGGFASVFFLKRASSMIEASPDDRDSLWEASCKVSRLTELFIDSSLAKRIREDLRAKIEGEYKGRPLD